MQDSNQGATVVITHHIRDDKIDLYEKWLTDISEAAKHSSGLLDWQIVKPIPNLTTTYTVLLRFDSNSHLENWMNSSERRQFIEQVRPYLVEGDDFYKGSGLDFLFMQKNSKQVPPKRWKQFLITWSAIFPLSMTVPLIVIPLLRAMNFPQIRYIDGFFVSGIIVCLMIYIIMPRYTKLIQPWLGR